MKWIGLTGGIGSGKTSVAAILKELKIPVVDADQVVAVLLRAGGEGVEPVVAAFGEEFRDSSGGIDRAQLGKKVFSEPLQLEILEKIIHPIVRSKVQEIKERLEKRSAKVAFYDVPLLFEKGMEPEFDLTVVVYADEGLRKKRLKDRNGWSDREIDNRFSAQLPLEEKRNKADFVIVNEGTREDLKESVLQFLHQAQL